MLPIFPDEIWLNIVSHVRSPSDALSLSLQCRKLHAMCDMANRKRYNRARLRDRNDGDRVLDMVLSILRRPQLGEYVQHFDMDRCLWYEQYPWNAIFPTREITREITGEERRLLQNAIGHIAFRDHGNRDRVLSVIMGEEDTHPTNDYTMVLSHALAALFISVCPYLESLGLNEVSYRGNRTYLLEVFFDDAVTYQGEIDYLQNVRNIAFTGENRYDRSCYADHNIGETLRLTGLLPSVEKYSTDGVETNEVDQTQLGLRSTNVRHISIGHANVNSGELAMLIASCKRLDILEYSNGGKRSNDSGYSGFATMDGVVVLNALLLHAATVRKLDLDVDAELSDGWQDDYDAEWNSKLPTDPGLTSMHNLNAMTHLSAGIRILFLFATGEYSEEPFAKDAFFLVDHLPPHLEYLCIRGYQAGKNAEHDRQVTALMENRDRCPSLKEIHGVDSCIPNSETVKSEDDAYIPERMNFEAFDNSFS